MVWKMIDSFGCETILWANAQKDKIQQFQVIFLFSFATEKQYSPAVPMSYEHVHQRLVELSGNEGQRHWTTKRVFDILCSAVALLLLMPFFLFLAALIYLDDPYGSPIYTQIRVGKNGKQFKLYKFRTMVVGADQMLDQLMERNEEDGPVFKMKDDPRVTKLGKLLRRTSIDELPQLWNVLQGDMSLVGPRPALPREVEQYSDHQLQRLLVTPGLTCYWQTQPKRNEIPFDRWMELDLQYIQDRTFLLDLKLIFKTIFVMIRREGL